MSKKRKPERCHKAVRREELPLGALPPDVIGICAPGCAREFRTEEEIVAAGAEICQRRWSRVRREISGEHFDCFRGEAEQNARKARGEGDHLELRKLQNAVGPVHLPNPLSCSGPL